MAATLGQVLAQIQQWASPRLGETSDALLLERFIERSDESAFAALVARHGAMVLRSCRRVLGNVHDAEDAFQATFLVLARKAHTLKHPDELPGWLHGVARRVALKARTKATARFGQLPLPHELPDAYSDPLEQLTARELLTVLDEEVSRLPRAQRSAVVLCCLEGCTQGEAARLLGCTAGSLKGHLERGRRRLQYRLASRGIALSAVLAITAVSHGQAVSVRLIEHTVKAVMSGGVSDPAAVLAHGVLKTMLWGKLAGVMTVVLTVALVTSTTTALVWPGPSAEAPEDKKPAVPAAPKEAVAAKPKMRTDELGDPLPEGALRRLGTLRFRYGWGCGNLLLTPDGKTLVSNESAGTVSVWDLVTGKLRRQFPGTLHGQRYIALSSDGKLVAIPHGEAIIVWDLATGKVVRRLAESNATGVAFSPDGKVLAADGKGEAGRAGIHLWDLSTGKIIAKLPWERGNHISAVLITYTPDGKTVIAGQWHDSRIGLWDVASGKKRQELDAKEGAIFSLALSPDGGILATGSQQGSVHLWDVKTGRLIRKFPTEAGRKGCTEVAFSPDGKSLAAVEVDSYSADSKDRNCISIWDVAAGKELSRFKGGSQLQKIVYSRDGNTLILASLGTIRLLDVATWKEVGPTAGSLTYLGPVWTSKMLSADGSILAYLRQSEVRFWEMKANREVSANQIRFWDMRTNREISSAIEFDCFFGCIMFALAPDGRTVAVHDDQNAINLWDIRSGKLLRCLQQGKKGRPDSNVLAFSPNGRFLAAAEPNAAGVRLLDEATGQQARRFPLMTANAAREGSNWIGICSTAFSPDGRLLAAAGRTRTEGSQVRIWEVATGKELPHLAKIMNAPNKEDVPSTPLGFGPIKIIVPNVAFSPNGTMLAKNARPKTISIWESATGQQRLLLKGHEDSTLCVTISPDNRTLASSSWDKTIRLWDLETGHELRKLTGHRGKADSLAFSADGKVLVSAGDDSTILFWDVADVTHRKRPLAASLNEREWQALWEDMAKDDATQAYRAMVRMAADGPATMATMRDRPRPIRPLDRARVARLLKELDSDDFAVRESAGRELVRLGDVVAPEVRQALSRPGLTLELRRRLEALDAALDEISGEALRQLRSVEVLEMLGTAEARELLNTIAAGAPGARLTEQAKAALERLVSGRRHCTQ